MSFLLRASALTLAVVALAIVTTATAAFPDRPIKLLCGFSPGGGLDISCRYWAQKLSTRLGVPVVVENKPGASGELAVRQLMTAAPDGYTLICLSGSSTISSSKANAPFDIRKDLVPVIQMTNFTFALYVNPSLPVKNLAELVAYAKARPGALNYGSVGAGSQPHLSFEVLKLQTGMDVVHVPFKGTAQAAAAVLAGDIQIGLDAIAAVKGNFDAGKLKPLAVISAKRTPTLPNVPGMQEAGVPALANVDITAWSGVAAPAGTPRAIVEQLNRELNAVLREPETAGIYAAQGYELGGGTPDDFARVIGSDIATWTRVITAAKLSIE